MPDEWDAWARPQRAEGQRERWWQRIRDTLATDPPDAVLCRLGVEAIEPLIDLYGPTVVDEFEAMTLRDARLRRALSCCWFDRHLPDEIREHLRALVRPKDDIGSQPASRG